MANKTLIDHRDDCWLQEKLDVLRFEIEEFKRTVERLFVTYCPFDLYMFNLHLVDHLIE